MHPQGFHVLHPSSISHLRMFHSPISFFTDYNSNIVPTDRWFYPTNGRNSWQYFANFHQDIVLCRHISFFPLTLNIALFSYNWFWLYAPVSLCTYIPYSVTNLTILFKLKCACVLHVSCSRKVCRKSYSRKVFIKHLLWKSILPCQTEKGGGGGRGWICNCSTRILEIVPVTVCSLFWVMF
jgi:hypothetical protein